MEATLNPDFSMGYEKTKSEIYEELSSRIDAVILNTIKEYLREKNIEFDGRSIDLQEFKNSVIPTLDKQTQIDVANIEQGLNEQLSMVTNELKEGSTTAFKKFTDVIGNFAKSSIESVARFTAIKTAYALSPTIGSISMGATILAPKAIETVKDIKKNMEENTNAALDVLLLKLGTIKKDGKIQSDIPEEAKNIIISNLKSEGIEISSKDSIDFLQELSNLENEKKEKAINILNNIKGNPYDIKEEMSKTKIDLAKIKKIIGDDIVAPLSTATLFGLAAGGTLTEIAPDLAPSVVTALSSGALTGDLGIGTLSGGGQYLLSKFGHYIPIVGEAVEDVTKKAGAKETILASTGVVVAATLGLKIIPKLIYKGVKGTYTRIKNKKEAREFKTKLDEQVATKNVEERIKEARENAKEEIESRSNKDILIDIIKDTIRSQGIAIPQEIKTKEELSIYVSKLSDKQKDEVYRISSILENIKENKTCNLKTTLSKVAKTAYWGGIIALAGLGAYDAFINPGFIEGLSSRRDLESQFKNQPKEKIVVGENNIQIEQEKINEQAKIQLKSRLDKANQEVKESIEDIRKILPQTKEEYSNLMEEEPGALTRLFKFWNNNKRYYKNNKAVELLGLNTEEGLDSFLHSISPNDENLKILMEKLNVNSIDELSKKYKLKESLDLVSGGNWYLPSTNEIESAGGFFSTELSGSEDIGNILIKIINSKYEKNVSEIPLQSASDEDIVEYIKSLSNDKGKINTLSTYIATNNEDANMLDYIAETIDDYRIGSNKVTELSEDINRLANDGMNMNEVKKGTKKISKLVNQYKKASDLTQSFENKSKGFMDGVNSNMTNNPWKIVGTGATIGAGLGTASESRNIFVRFKDFIKSKFLSKNKQKALPSGEKEDVENIKGKKNYLSEIKVEGLEESSKKKSISKRETKENNEQEFDR